MGRGWAKNVGPLLVLGPVWGLRGLLRNPPPSHPRHIASSFVESAAHYSLILAAHIAAPNLSSVWEWGGEPSGPIVESKGEGGMGKGEIK